MDEQGFCMSRIYCVMFVPHRKQVWMSGHGQCRNYFYLVITYIFLFSFLASSASSQDLRAFPPLFNVARDRPVFTSPSDSTCGVPTRNAFCKSSVFPISVDQCVQEFCVQTCPNRTALPNFIDLLIGNNPAIGYCIVTDVVNTRPASRAGEFSMFFLRGGPNCFISPSTSVDLGDGGALTVTFWLWYDTTNSGSLLQKVTSNTREIIFEILLAGQQISVKYRSTDGLATVTLGETIPRRTWVHIAIQVYQSTLSFYVNDVLPGFSPVQTFTLVSPIQDGPGTARVGQNSAGGNQFLGRIQDFKFFQHTLSNREIQEVYSGSLPDLRIQSECRCPPTHPRIKPSRQHYCIRNGVPDSDVDDILRLNPEGHNLEFVNDGDTETTWITKFQNEVFLTLDLGDDFQVFFVVLQFYSPMPKAVVIERQVNGSDDWKVWQMYAQDCLLYFSQVNNGPLASPDSVNCIQFGSGPNNVTYSNGNITFILLSSDPVPRPKYNDFYGTPELQEFVKASKIRIKMQDHYFVKFLRHEYFGIYELVVNARCDCHGHAVNCDTSELPYKCNCTADSFTEENKCDRCHPLYNNKPFRRGDQLAPYHCVPCQCHGHADSCVYNATLDLFPGDHDLGGGGVCQNCRHNTTGRFCDTCVSMYYRPVGKSKYDLDVCQPCNCSAGGIVNNNADCRKDGGQCYCKKYVSGRACDTCSEGYYNLRGSNPEGCEGCGCNTSGTLSGSTACHLTTGQCSCKDSVRNAKCDSCEFGYYNLSAENPKGCEPCECNPQGSTSQFCDPVSGQCQCKDHVTGRRCDRCAAGFQDFDKGCNSCQCDVQGTIANTVCDHVSGQCVCKENVQGIQCDECKEGTYGFGSSSSEGCTDCLCDLSGTVNVSLICNKATGNCLCKQNVEGKSCNRCKGNTYGLSKDNELGCDPCNCDPTGTEGGDTNLPEDLSCDQNTGACSCLAKRLGRRCEKCQAHYFVFPAPGGGCQPCGCNFYSTIPLTYCDSLTGQCQCKEDVGVTGRTCSTCQVGYFNFNVREGKCTPCDCDTAGSLNDTCHGTTGQCMCKQFVTGRRCDTCMEGTSFLDPDNPYGCSKEPTQQPPPEYTTRTATEISLQWRVPDYPNGVIVKYRLFRNGTLVFTGNGTDQSYNDTGLYAYTLYTYIVEATNDFGTTGSIPVTFRTLPGPPTGIVIVDISNIHPTSATITWTLPAKLNGPLANYTVISRSTVSPDVKVTHWTGITRGTTISGLVPYMNYTVMVITCSTGGCLDSLERSFTTKPSLPAGMAPPRVITLSSSELYVEWAPPSQANGIIIFYELWMRGELQSDGSRDPVERRIFNPSGQYNPRPTLAPQENVLPPPDTNYTVTGLDPFTVYEFQVLAENDIGKTASPWVAGRTGEAIPVTMDTPEIQPISSSELMLTWTEPSVLEARGIIAAYRVYFYEKIDLTRDPYSPPYVWKLLATTPGGSRSHLIDRLIPYTNYTFMVGACNSVGCVNSTQVMESTLQDVPEGLYKPRTFTVNSTMIELSWVEPAVLNGPHPLYSVEKTVPSLSFPPIVTQGTRFPGGGYYLFSPEILPYDVGFTGIRFKFRTRKSSSLLFFAASAGKQEEFVAVQFKSGRPWFLFDPQDCFTNITIDVDEDNNQTYHDNEWHSLSAIRDNEYSRLTLDDVYQDCPSFVTPTNDEGLPYNDYRWHRLLAIRTERSANISIDSYWRGTREQRHCASSTGTVIGRSTGVYIGGLPSDFAIRRGDTDSRMQVIREGFMGCIKDIEILTQMYPTQVWTPVDWTKAEMNEQSFQNWEGCPENLEYEDDAVHFLGEGYVTVPGTIWDMYNQCILQFKFRTDLANGALFFAYGGDGIYFYLALVSNSIYFEFSDGTATGSVTYSNPDVRFCNGEWYSVSVDKNGQRGRIYVDGLDLVSSGDENFRLYVKTISDLYIGGVPENSAAWDFIEKHNLNVPKQGFGGCLKDIRLTLFYPVFHTKRIVISESMLSLANVNMDGCSPFLLPEETCKGDIVQNIYNGTDLFYTDAGLQPYSDYLYRVLASNDGGIGTSPWRYARTKEGAPQGVKAPHNVSVLSGYVIQASWQPPISSSGLLSKYILRAYSLDSPDLAPVEAEFTNLRQYTGQITTAVPFTNYTVKVAICTGGGCSESSTGVKVVTMEEAPQDVGPPTADAGVSYLNVQWKLPGQPNGVITGFILYHDGKQIYSGAQRNYNLTGLQVYTAYQFTLRACTRVGCTDSPSVSLRTAQLPPTFVKAPTVIALDTTRVEVRWEEPDQLNGVLERYQLYVTSDNSTLGAMVYDSGDFFLNNIITHLVAGTTYYITLGACTAGGCTLSDASSTTTKEGAPEGVIPPVLTSSSPSELTVTWMSPALPNGNILRYILYHNEVKVYNGLDMNFTISGLKPYSLQTVRLEVCTIKGCGSSTMVTGRTMEAPPTGFIVMEMKVNDARTVEVKWSPPAEENGIIYYDVYFEGNFYAAPESYNFTLVQDRRSLFQGHNVSEWVEISHLVPVTQYDIQVNASNTVGYVLSNTLTASMPEGTPDGVTPPMLISETSTSILVTWKPVGKANSPDDPLYTVQFRDQNNNGSMVYDIFGPTTTFLHTKQGLQPYTVYEFRIRATNSYGSTYSDWVKQTTQQDRPQGFDPPLIGAIGARYVDITWQRPLVANGVIKEYKIYQDGVYKQTVNGNSSSLRVSELSPFTPYTFAAEACTLGGCRKTGDSSTVRTLEDVPVGMARPSLVSLTPTSVEVKWLPVNEPNGIINEYTIERRLNGSQKIVNVGKVLPTAELAFIDESSELSPFTSYEYRIKITNGVGSAHSSWHAVTTKSTRPAGVMPPGVNILSPTSMRITWQPPLKLNGLLEYYIVRLPDPQREIRNISVLSITVTNLTAYTSYSVTVTACTDGGCAESAPVPVRTLPTVPEGQLPPLPSVISQTLITLTWQGPEKSNGPNIRFELARMKLRQPLQEIITDLNIWKSLYTGTGTYFEDRGLPIFTTFVYRITVYNDVGQLTSSPCNAVTTHGGFPRKAAEVNVVALSHTELKVSWITPNITMLQGSVSEITLSAQSKPQNITQKYRPGTSNITLHNLTPNTDYTVRVTITVHGGEKITSQPVTGTTLDGAPEGVHAPSVTVLSDTSIRVSWTPPDTRNGEITGYSIYANDKKTPTNMAAAGSYVLTKLLPYTVYAIQIEVCTIFDCTKSAAVLITTTETLPQGQTPPFVVSDSPTTVDITWTKPTQPNGIILRYDLIRKTIKLCADIPPPTMNPEWTKCTYVECPILENQCGGICYSGAKVCCNGTVHDSKEGHDCCGTQYLPKPSQDAVCCGDQFHARKTNHECCGQRYVKVLPGQTCCRDDVENRVTVGYGDTCCGTIPYYLKGSQICCRGILSPAYGSQCCGGEVVSDGMACCGDGHKGRAYTSVLGHTCCGIDYSPKDTTLCCTSDTGHTMTHIYPDSDAKAAANEKCCGIEKISSSLDCCNYRGYNPNTHVCADFSSTEQGCGYGNVCPVSQKPTALCDRCDFNESTQTCGFRPGYHGNIIMPTTPNPKDNCVLREDNIYTGLNMSFTDDGLEPYSVYQYTITVVNSAGGTRSGASEVTTQQWYPERVDPPRALVNPSQLYVIDLTWKIPDKPNGEIIRYILLRDGIEVYRGMEYGFTDDTTILPYKSYSYTLTACTIAGCTTSEKVTIATAEGIPEAMMAPRIVDLTSRSFKVTWSPPERANGIISGYVVSMSHHDETVIKNRTSANTLSIHYTELLPYTNYTVEVEACTEQGCTKSPPVSSITLEDLPEGIFPPRLIVISATSNLVFWSAPLHMNGQFKFYSVMRVWNMGARQVYVGSGFSVDDRNLTPGWRYSYYLIVGTGNGNTSSSMISVTMPTDMLNNIPAPKSVTVQSAERIYVEWDPIVPSEGTVDQYGVKLNAGLDSEVDLRVGLNISVLVTGLKPYFYYSVRRLVCLAGKPNGCGIGPAVTVRTHEAPPTGLEAPIVKVIGSDIINIKWKPPKNPNGVILQYLVYYRELGSMVDLLIDRLRGEILTARHAGRDLLPFTQYQYKVVAGNSKGDIASPWTTVRTLEAPPQDMARPIINSTHAFGFGLSWQPPATPNGEITKYRIVYRLLANTPTGKNPLHMIDLPATSLYSSVSGLTPYSNYEVYISTFNSVGNITSEWTIVQTGQSSPAGMQDFEVEKITSGTAVILHWDPPASPYGIIVIYRIYEEGSDIALYQGLNPEFEFRRLRPYTEYTVQLEACTLAGCTLGRPQSFVTAESVPSDQAAPTPGPVNATSAQIVWTRPVNPNGVITMYEVLRQSQTLGGIQKRSYSDPMVVYMTTDTDKDTYEFTDSGLQPYTEYQYSVRASNSQGSTQSPWQSVFTDQAAPEGVQSPLVTFVDGEVDKLNIQWVPPTTPNGILLNYQLQRNDSVPLSFSAGDRLEYLDFNLDSYSVYSYTVKACTTGGCTVSEPTLIRTKETPPNSVKPPVLIAVNSTAMSATWKPPPSSNGEITQYQLLMNGRVIYTGSSTTYTENGLVPYKEYTFSLRACTNGGCTESGEVTARPDDDAPSGMLPPVLSVLSSKSIEITWQPPLRPNGVITSYDLRRDGALIFTDSVSISGSLKTTYIDFGLTPGTEYSYVVIARNRKGSAESTSSKVTTYSASPSGLDPPKLQPLSSTSIQATWKAPVNPNGVIRNYTLYIDGTMVYSAGTSAFSYVMPGLDYWTEYTFRIQACTDRGCELSGTASAQTLESAPEEQGGVTLLALANDEGGHSGVLITWEEPGKPNGVILRYEVYRRQLIKEKIGSSFGPVIQIYNGTRLRYSDYDDHLKPNTEYQYMVSSVNMVGKAEGPWASILTKEASPSELQPPTVQETTSSTITVRITPPINPNGVIRYYSVLFNGTVGSSSVDLIQTIGLNVALKPYTIYSIQVQACTSGGCTVSVGVSARTGSATPTGQGPVIITETNSTAIRLRWNYPTQQNGEIIRFKLYQRTSCPPPSQPFPQSCVVGDTREFFTGLAIEKTITNLLPYSAYEFQIVSENQAGLSDLPPWMRGDTSQRAPVYIRFPLLYKNGSLAVVDWRSSFELNGRLREYILIASGRVLFRGVATLYEADKETSASAFSFTVTVITDVGQAESPTILFDPNAIDNIGSTSSPDQSLGTSSSQSAFYQEMWFIVLLVLIAVLLLFVIVALCLRHIDGRRPYIRERTSLSDRQQKSMEPFPFFDESSTSSMYETEMSGKPYQQHRGLYDTSFGATTNTAYSHSDRKSSVLDKMSFTSSQLEEDFIEDEDFLWRGARDGHLVFGEEVESTAAPSFVMTAAPVFTDTHI